MGTKQFPAELDSRGTVKVTDKLIIHNIDTGATEYTTVAELLTAFVVEGTWVPTHNLTVVNGTGDVTLSGKYIKIGNFLKWQVTIVVTGTATHASTAGSTEISLPYAVLPDTCTIVNYASWVGAISGNVVNSTIGTPSWTASNNYYIISGTSIIA